MEVYSKAFSSTVPSKVEKAVQTLLYAGIYF